MMVAYDGQHDVGRNMGCFKSKKVLFRVSLPFDEIQSHLIDIKAFPCIFFLKKGVSMKPLILFSMVISLFLFAGCSASSHKAQVQNDSTDRITVGTVQREIRVGMSSADVVAALGSPNMVSTDDQRREVWVYDKMSTDVSYSQSSGYGTLLLVGGEMSSGAASRSQRTLTIIVKFDNDQKVRDFAYRQSSF